jgi:hypothetical protein
VRVYNYFDDINSSKKNIKMLAIFLFCACVYALPSVGCISITEEWEYIEDKKCRSVNNCPYWKHTTRHEYWMNWRYVVRAALQKRDVLCSP